MKTCKNLKTTIGIEFEFLGELEDKKPVRLRKFLSASKKELKSLIEDAIYQEIGVLGKLKLDIKVSGVGKYPKNTIVTE